MGLGCHPFPTCFQSRRVYQFRHNRCRCTHRPAVRESFLEGVPLCGGLVLAAVPAWGSAHIVPISTRVHPLPSSIARNLASVESRTERFRVGCTPPTSIPACSVRAVISRTDNGRPADLSNVSTKSNSLGLLARRPWRCSACSATSASCVSMNLVRRSYSLNSSNCRNRIRRPKRFFRACAITESGRSRDSSSLSMYRILRLMRLARSFYLRVVSR